MNKDLKKNPLFSDLGKFRGKKITVILTNGQTIYGKLVSFDDACNIILEKCSDWVYGKNVMCLGKCLSLVSLGQISAV